MLGNSIPFGWIKVANALICSFNFRLLSQSCFIYINPKVSLFFAALLGFDDRLKIMNCITKGHIVMAFSEGEEEKLLH